jgi:hypothetical protein
MTVPTDLRRCTGWYTFASAGWDGANSRLIDQSGLSFHLPLVSGSAPAFIARTGVSCIDLDNTFFFERANPIPITGSIVFKFHTDAATTSGNLTIFNWQNSKYPTGDHVALTRVTPWEANDARQVVWISSSNIGLRMTTLVGGDPIVTIGTAGLPINTWHVVTLVWNMRNLSATMRVGAATPVTDAVTPEANVGPQQHEDLMRLGYLKPSGGLTVPHHMSVAEVAFFQDDILANQPAEAAALVASWT